MSQVKELDKRYADSASLVRHGVEVVAVRDDLGKRFDVAVRSVFGLIQRDGPDVWDQLFGTAKALRYCLITDPMPIEENARLKDLADEVVRESRLLMGAVDEDDLLREISDAAAALFSRDPLVGGVLLESLDDVGLESAIVIASSTRSREALSAWLGPLGGRVLTLGDLERAEISEDFTYFVGPPRFFKPTAVTAPRTRDVAFIVPEWFSDRAVRSSVISQYAEGGIQVAVRPFEVGDSPTVAFEPVTREDESVPEEELLPQPVWGDRVSEERAPNEDEVEARKILLSGNRAIWLDDDGERIRSLDPKQPPGERVGYTDVSVLAPGDYLLLREGEAEREALRERALARIGAQASSVRCSQLSWKSVLIKQIYLRGVRDSESALRELGVRAAGQMRTWASPHTIRPQSDDDFLRLLDWLGLSTQPYFGNAVILRKEVHRASRELRKQLEEVADAIDLHALERVGHMSLDTTESGFRGMFIAKVLAVAPFTELIARHEARVPFDDEGAQWLE